MYHVLLIIIVISTLYKEVIYTVFWLSGSSQQVVWTLKTVKSETSFLKRAVKWHGEYNGENRKKKSLCILFQLQYSYVLLQCPWNTKWEGSVVFQPQSSLQNFLHWALAGYMIHQASRSGLNSPCVSYQCGPPLQLCLGKPYNIPICPAVLFLISQNPTWQTSVTEKM